MAATKIEHNNSIMGGVPITEMFRPVNTTYTVTDRDGNKWRQITAMGFQRICDKFFWPADPTNSNNRFNRYPPSVEEMSKPVAMPPNGICVDLNTGKYYDN